MQTYFKTQQNKMSIFDIQQYQYKFIRELKEKKKTCNYSYFTRKPKTFLLLEQKAVT